MIALSCGFPVPEIVTEKEKILQRQLKYMKKF